MFDLKLKGERGEFIGESFDRYQLVSLSPIPCLVDIQAHLTFVRLFP